MLLCSMLTLAVAAEHAVVQRILAPGARYKIRKTFTYERGGGSGSVAARAFPSPRRPSLYAFSSTRVEK